MFVEAPVAFVQVFHPGPKSLTGIGVAEHANEAKQPDRGKDEEKGHHDGNILTDGAMFFEV